MVNICFNKETGREIAVVVDLEVGEVANPFRPPARHFLRPSSSSPPRPPRVVVVVVVVAVVIRIWLSYVPVYERFIYVLCMIVK